MEIWKPIPGYEGYYEASNTGLIRSVPRTIILKTKKLEDRPCEYKSKILKPYLSQHNRSNILPRQQIVLSVDGKTKSLQVHRLIAQTFIPNPNNYETVNHIDGNTFNNTVENLEWISKVDNIRHSFKNNLVHTQKPVVQIDPKTNEIIKIYPGESEACRRRGISQGKIGRAIRRNGTCRGYKWKYVNNEGVTTIESWKGFSE